MAKEQTHTYKRVAAIKRNLPRFDKEIKQSREKTGRLEIKRGKLIDEMRRLREACGHNYKEEWVQAGLRGICAICGDKRLLKEFPHPRNCDCISCDGSQAHP